MAALPLNQIREKIATHQPEQLTHPNFKKSAVLIALIPTDDGYDIVMTSRSARLRHHKGEMSFPGGKFDTDLDKTLRDTALRETCEEIGIPRANVEIIGAMDDFPTITGYIIRPFVAIITNPKDVEFHINPDEVAHVVRIPISFLTKDGLFNQVPFPIKEANFYVLSFKFPDPEHGIEFNIWGASAHLLSTYLHQVYDLQVTTADYRRPELQEIDKYLIIRSKSKEERKNRRKRRKN